MSYCLLDKQTKGYLDNNYMIFNAQTITYTKTRMTDLRLVCGRIFAPVSDAHTRQVRAACLDTIQYLL